MMPGQIGPYTLMRKLGEGGMSEVYLAEHVPLRRKAALKILDPARAGRHAAFRFGSEVRHTRRLVHPHTVQIYDYGRSPEGLCYYAMEYLEGLTLGQLVRRHGAQPASRVAALLLQAASALAEAHGHGLLHRDVKPSNLMLMEHRSGDFLKLFDFGLVRQMTAGESRGGIAGTPGYLAPEAITSPSEVDPRSDLYSLGCVAYLLLCGREVFEATSLTELCARHLCNEPAPPSSRAEVPAELDALVMRLLAKDPNARFESSDALCRAIAALESRSRWTASQARAWWEVHGDAAPGTEAEDAPSTCTLPTGAYEGWEEHGDQHLTLPNADSWPSTLPSGSHDAAA